MEEGLSSRRFEGELGGVRILGEGGVCRWWFWVGGYSVDRRVLRSGSGYRGRVWDTEHVVFTTSRC